MLMPCEIVTKQFVPALRACIIKDLYNKHKLTQIQIAKKLNLTQASISKYLAEDYGKDIKELVAEIYGEFIKFDFPNGDLRKKFDGMKYDLKKLEDLVFELKIKDKV